MLNNKKRMTEKNKIVNIYIHTHNNNSKPRRLCEAATVLISVTHHQAMPGIYNFLLSLHIPSFLFHQPGLHLVNVLY